MAFMVSKVQTSFSESEAEKDSETVGPISSELHLKPSPHALDKQAVLRRIRHHKSFNKLRGAFQALVSGSGQTNIASIKDQEWLNQDDAFSSP
ncbi:hypothetical protein SLA2020_403260 [Shorea laevis]